MTQEDKQLLLKDLCARLPYGVIVHIHNLYEDVDDYDRQLIGEYLDFIELDRMNCKPYLRPMSSMTEIERKDIESILYDWDRIDYYNAHHFDYRDLIEKGLALEAPKGMYGDSTYEYDIVPGFYRCIHRMFDGTPDGKLLFEVGNIYQCLAKNPRAEFEWKYGHSVYLTDPVVRECFVPIEAPEGMYEKGGSK